MLSVKRLTRVEQNERNRALVMEAARQVFLSRGYHAATVEEIADEAGFSRGVVYSRFGTKADMFLALLTDRIAERAAQNLAAAGKPASAGISEVHEVASRTEAANPGWRQLVTEFRVHAARDPELSERYAAVHAVTVDGVASVVALAAARGGHDLAVPARQLAELLLAIETGLALERLADPAAVSFGQMPVVLGELTALLGGSPASAQTGEVRQR